MCGSAGISRCIRVRRKLSAPLLPSSPIRPRLLCLRVNSPILICLCFVCLFFFCRFCFQSRRGSSRLALLPGSGQIPRRQRRLRGLLRCGITLLHRTRGSPAGSVTPPSRWSSRYTSCFQAVSFLGVEKQDKDPCVNRETSRRYQRYCRGLLLVFVWLFLLYLYLKIGLFFFFLHSFCFWLNSWKKKKKRFLFFLSLSLSISLRQQQEQAKQDEGKRAKERSREIRKPAAFCFHKSAQFFIGLKKK